MKVSTCLLFLIVVICVTSTLSRKFKNGKSVCKYSKKGQWGACDPATNMMTKTLRLKKGGAECEPERTITKKCKKKKKKKKNRCKYAKTGGWSTCDPLTNKKTKTFTLQSGDPTVCETTKIKTKTCKVKTAKGCKYSKGKWSDCVDGQKTRMLTLKRGDPATCLPTRTKTKRCR